MSILVHYVGNDVTSTKDYVMRSVREQIETYLVTNPNIFMTAGSVRVGENTVASYQGEPA